MGLMFNILAILNNVGCVLTLTVFILYHRNAFKKNSWEQLGEKRGRFREHSIVMLWWIFGTLLISIFNLNILFIFPLLILGAFSATFWSVSPNPQDRDPLHPANLQQQFDFSAELPGGNRELIQPEMSPSQAALLPDLGNHLSQKGVPQDALTAYPSFMIKDIAVVGLGSYCVTRVQEIDGKLYCGAFDFGNDELESILAQATESTRDAVAGSLKDDPQSVRHIPISDPIHVGIKAALGKPQQGIDETFIPLMITEVFPAH
jgi:hypothetical protein